MDTIAAFAEVERLIVVAAHPDDLETVPQQWDVLLLEFSEKDVQEVKKAARTLLDTLKAERLVLDWRRRQQSRAAVRVTIEETLDNLLPDAYTPELFRQKCDAVYQHMYESCYGAGRSVYSESGLA